MAYKCAGAVKDRTTRQLRRCMKSASDAGFCYQHNEEHINMAVLQQDSRCLAPRIACRSGVRRALRDGGHDTSPEPHSHVTHLPSQVLATPAGAQQLKTHGARSATHLSLKTPAEGQPLKAQVAHPKRNTPGRLYDNPAYDQASDSSPMPDLYGESSTSVESELHDQNLPDDLATALTKIQELASHMPPSSLKMLVSVLSNIADFCITLLPEPGQISSERSTSGERTASPTPTLRARPITAQRALVFDTVPEPGTPGNVTNRQPGYQTVTQTIINTEGGRMSFNVMKPIYDHHDNRVDQELINGFTFYGDVLSTKECNAVAQLLPYVIKTDRKGIPPSAHMIMVQCTDRVVALVNQLHPGQYRLKKSTKPPGRHQPASMPGDLHFDGPKGEHTYDLRVAVRVPRKRVTSFIKFKHQHRPVTHTFALEPGQAYSMTNTIGLKRFQTPWMHGNGPYEGMTWILDFKNVA